MRLSRRQFLIGAAAYVLARTCGVAGFFGASSVERLPTEIAITEQVKQFKSIAITQPV